MKLPEKLDDNLIVKVGTNNMARKSGGRERLDHASIRRIAGQILDLRASGLYVSLVSSGAVSAGMEATGTPVRPNKDDPDAMPETQRLATRGWHRVVMAWEQALGEVGVGGLLVTKHDLDINSLEHDDALKTIYTLLRWGEVPVINGNDGTTHEGLSVAAFGQNDTLSATYAAQVAGSEYFGNNVRLVLLTDVDGVFQDLEV